MRCGDETILTMIVACHHIGAMFGCVDVLEFVVVSIAQKPNRL